MFFPYFGDILEVYLDFFETVELEFFSLIFRDVSGFVFLEKQFGLNIYDIFGFFFFFQVCRIRSRSDLPSSSSCLFSKFIWIVSYVSLGFVSGTLNSLSLTDPYACDICLDPFVTGFRGSLQLLFPDGGKKCFLFLSSCRNFKEMLHILQQRLKFSGL